MEKKNKVEEESTGTGIVLESCDGVEITVQKTEKERNPLPVKEWLLAEIANIQKQLPTKKGWSPNLNWEFLIKEDGFENRKVWMNTSMIASLDSKLYNYYLSVMGLQDIEDGAIIKPTDMIGKLCYVMVVNSTKKKGKQLISEIKNYNPKDVKSDLPSGKADVKKEVVAEKKVNEETKKNDEEVNTDDINLDDL